MIEILKHLTFLKLFQFSKLLIGKPLFIIPAIWSSVLALKICQKEFGNAQYSSGKANAYRHAIWVQYLLYFSRFSKHNEIWVQRFTQQYEDTFLNSAPNRAMDLHNNEVSIQNYTKNLPRNTKEIQDNCQVLLLHSQKIFTISYQSDIKKYSNQLVYF